jgi:eukaryotic-like serine/threonine-protein kinase
MGGDDRDETELPAGCAVHRYLVIERVGIDATASIYSAYDPNLDRKVAVKILRGPQAELDAGALLVAEAQSLAKLTHANVVRVHDVGTFEGQVFVAREFIEGRSLLRWMREAPRSRAQIQRALALAGRGLAAAHEAGIVHGGVRPRSVLVADDGKILVTDFGVGAAADETRPYAAPEIRADSPATPQSDQFAYAAMVLEALTGHPATQLVPNGVADRDEITQAARKLPGRLLRAVEVALTMDPALRHASVASIVEQLEPRRRSKHALVGIGAVAAAGAVAIPLLADRDAYCDDVGGHLHGVWDDSTRRAIRRAFDHTKQPYATDVFRAVEARLDHLAQAWVEAQTSACLSAKETDDDLSAIARRMYCLERRFDELRAVTEVLADADSDVVKRALDVVQGIRPVSTCQGFLQDVPVEAQRGAVGAIEAGLSQAEALRSAGRVDEAVSLSNRLVREAEALGYAPIEVSTIGARALIGSTLPDPSNADRLHDAFSRALAIGDRDLLADLARAIASDLTEDRQYPQAERWTDYAQALLDGVVMPPNHPGLAGVTMLRGRLASLQGRYDDATTIFEEALAQRVAQLGAHHRAVAAHRANLGQAYQDAGRYAEAEREFRAALDLQRAAVGEHHPAVAQMHLGLAGLASMMGRAEPALEHAQQGLAIVRAVHGDAHPLVGDAHIYVAGALSMLDRDDEALEHFDWALAVYRETTGEGSFRTAVTYANIAVTHLNMGHGPQAKDYYEQAIERLRETLGDEHPMLFQHRGNRVGALLILQLWDEAELEARTVIDELAKRLGPDHPSASYAHEALAEVHAVRGRDERAIAQLERALELRADRGEVERAHTSLLLAHAWRRAGLQLERADILEAEARATLTDNGPYGERNLRTCERALARIAAARSSRPRSSSTSSFE